MLGYVRLLDESGYLIRVHTNYEMFHITAYFDGSPPKRYQRKLVKVPTTPKPRSKRVPLHRAKKSQLHVRLKPIVDGIRKICVEEKVDDFMTMIALICRSVFLDPNSQDFNKIIGKFFQSYLLGKQFLVLYHYN